MTEPKDSAAAGRATDPQADLFPGLELVEEMFRVGKAARAARIEVSQGMRGQVEGSAQETTVPVPMEVFFPGTVGERAVIVRVGGGTASDAHLGEHLGEHLEDPQVSPAKAPGGVELPLTSDEDVEELQRVKAWLDEQLADATRPAQSA